MTIARRTRAARIASPRNIRYCRDDTLSGRPMIGLPAMVASVFVRDNLDRGSAHELGDEAHL
jgi:hypothetical protein